MKLILSFTALLIYYSVFSQTSYEIPSEFSVNAGGGVTVGQQGNCSFSIGQVFFNQIFDKEVQVQNGVQNVQISNKGETGNESDILVYPNPVKDVLFLRFETDNFEDLAYQLIELGGKSMATGAIENVISEINVGYLKQGLFVLLVMRKNKFLSSIRIIKK